MTETEARKRLNAAEFYLAASLRYLPDDLFNKSYAFLKSGWGARCKACAPDQFPTIGTSANAVP